MNKVNAFLLLAILVLLVGIAYVFSMNNAPAETPSDSNTADEEEFGTIEEDGYTLEYVYEGENTWSYTVSGQVPTPCYETEVDAIVAESFPEQVTVRLALTPPDDSVVCIQVTREFEASGEFSASEAATVDFVVTDNAE
jgi:hypothetical protein